MIRSILTFLQYMWYHVHIGVNDLASTSRGEADSDGVTDEEAAKATDHSSRLCFNIPKGWERDGWLFSLMIENWPKMLVSDDLRLQNL